MLITPASEAALSTVARLPVPEVPAGMTTAAFGKLIDWEGSSAEAIERIGQVSADKLREAGVTAEMAEKWAEFYANEVMRNPGNRSAAGRADLMNHVADILRR